MTEVTYGPFTQQGQLQGVVIAIGDQGNLVSVHLQDGDRTHICHAHIQLSKDLAKHHRGNPVRVSGQGRWFRDAIGQWTMLSFQISDFAILDDEPLNSVIAKLQQIPGAWKERPNILAELRSLREDNEA